MARKLLFNNNPIQRPVFNLALRTYASLSLLLISLIFISISLGPLGYQPFVGLLQGDETAFIIISEYRFPRVLAAILLGSGLGLSGACLQGLTRNPLADHAILGISGSAAMFCVVAFYFFSVQTGLGLTLLSFLGAASATILLLWVSSNTIENMLRLILVGIAISTITTAVIALMLNLAPNPFAAYETMRWLMGSVAHVQLNDIPIPMIAIVLGMFIMGRTAMGLDHLSLGDQEARALGTSRQNISILIIVGNGFCVADA
jgi:ABC-type Fe3+-siderophore transport system, permease component